jgi:predicted nucleic acid-binding protein
MRRIRRRNIRYPSPFDDSKLMKVAIAVQGEFILSTDNHLLEMTSIRFNDRMLEIIETNKYVKTRCPSFSTNQDN